MSTNRVDAHFARESERAREHALSSNKSLNWDVRRLREARRDEKERTWRERERERAETCRKERERESKGGERKREFAERKHFCWMGEKQPWKLHQKKTKTRGRTKEVPMSAHKEPVHFFSLLCLLGL